MADEARNSLLLHELFYRSVESFSQRIAVKFVGESVQSITFCDLEKIVRNLSCCFSRIFSKNEVVGVLNSDQHLHLPAVLLAVLDASAAFYPLSASSSLHMVIESLERRSVRYVLVETCLSQDSVQVLGESEEVGRSTSGNRRLELYNPQEKELHSLLGKVQFTLFRVVHADKCVVRWKEDLAYVMQTSGTTGEPKAVFVPHSCIVPNIIHLSSIFGVTCEDTVFLASPYTFDPFIVQMFLALSNGALLLMVPDTAKLLPQFLCQKLFDEHKISIFQPTPSFLYYIGPHLINEKILSENSSVSVLAIGGEACPLLSTLRKWKHPKCQTKLYNIYGITEVSSWATCHYISDEDLNEGSNSSQFDLRNHCPLGHPLSQTKLFVYDENGSAVNGDGVGRLWIGGSDRKCLLEGESEDCIAVVRDSGDLVEVKSGQMYYLGRVDNQLKRFGHRINLEYIEKVILEATDVISCSMALATAAGGKIIHLFVAPAKSMPGEVETFTTDLKERLKEILPRASYPDRIHVISRLPLTEHGKVDKRQLLRSLADVDSNEEVPVVELLSSMWLECCQNNREVKRCTTVDQEDSGTKTVEPAKVSCGRSKTRSPKSEDMFIVHGGDSFGAVRLADTIERWVRKRWETHIDMSMLVDIILNRTFIELVDYVEKQGRKTVAELKPGSTCRSIERPQCQDSELAAKKLKLDNDSDTSHISPIVQERMSETIDRQCTCFARRGSDRVLCRSCRGNSKCLLSSPSILWKSSDQCPTEFHIGVKWKTSLGKCIDASPLVLPSCFVDQLGVVFIGSHSHVFMSVSLSSGDILWKTQLDGRVESSSCLSLCGQLIVVGCYDGKVYVLARNNGNIAWTYQTGDLVKSSPCLDNHTGLVWVGSHDSYLYALDIERKQCTIRVHCLEGSCFSSPSISYQVHQVYIGTLAGRFLTVDAVTGEIRWSKKFDKPIFSSPLAQDGHVYVATVDGSLKCFDHRGDSLWEFLAVGSIFSSPVSYLADKTASGSEIVLTTHDHWVYCISRDSKCKWSFFVDGPVYSTPCIASCRVSKAVDVAKGDGVPCIYFVIVVVTTNGTLYLLDAADGRVLKTFSFPGEVFSSPVVVGQQIVIGCRNDYLYCVELS